MDAFHFFSCPLVMLMCIGTVSTSDLMQLCSYSTQRVVRLVEDISGLIEDKVVELSSTSVKKTDMKEHAIYVAVARPGVARVALMVPIALQEAKKVQKSIFDLKLKSYSSSFLKQLETMQEIYKFTDLGIWQIVQLVDKALAVFKKGASNEEREHIIQKMKAFGAKVVMVQNDSETGP